MLKDYLFILIPVAKTALIVNVLLVSVAAMTWVERRLSAVIQFRLGPNRVGPFGVLQPFADGLKFITVSSRPHALIGSRRTLMLRWTRVDCEAKSLRFVPRSSALLTTDRRRSRRTRSPSDFCENIGQSR